MKLSRTVVYALRATIRIAQAESPQPIPCSRLAAEGSMPERFLLQILRTLVTADILVSTRGVEGGYRLAAAPEQITLLAIFEAIEGPLNAPTQLGEEFPAISRERLLEALSRVDSSVRENMQAVSLADLAATANVVNS